ncbi:MAG: hypothetical protein AAF466_01725 [Bacteroidota bacterium]
MSDKNTKLDNRDTLKSYFKNGKRPSEENFESLIDSTINKLEDGISKEPKNGLVLAPEGENNRRTLSFVNKIGSEHPDWSISLVKGDPSGLGIVKPTADDDDDITKLFFSDNGHIGVHTNQPVTPLDVNGVLGTKSRMGTYRAGVLPADGQWRDVTEPLSGCKAFEVIAQAGGEAGEGKYALLHATALATHGQRINRIRRTQAFFGWFWWNRLAIRWKREKSPSQESAGESPKSNYNYVYKLQLKTRSNYGKATYIKYHITTLWDNEISELIPVPSNEQNE